MRAYRLKVSDPQSNFTLDLNGSEAEMALASPSLGLNSLFFQIRVALWKS